MPRSIYPPLTPLFPFFFSFEEFELAVFITNTFEWKEISDFEKFKSLKIQIRMDVSCLNCRVA